MSRSDASGVLLRLFAPIASTECCLRSQRHRYHHLKSTLDAGVALVCLDRTVPGVKTDAVLFDNVRGARECVRHMIQKDHRRIAIITGPLDIQTGRERLRGYEEALREADIPAEKGRTLEGDFRHDSGYRLGKQIIERPARERAARPTAIFVCNGVMTLGVSRHSRR
jgi:LacI family transcriptional regulator